METICGEGTKKQWKLEELWRLVTGTLPEVGGKHKNHFFWAELWPLPG